MRVLLYSKFGQYPQNLEQFVKDSGLDIVKENPDVVITFGGDGTLLGAERDFPAVPKLPLKESGIGYHAIQKPIEETLELFTGNKLQIRQYFKLEVTFGEKKFLALNEVTIRNSLPTSALRFSVESHPEQRPINIGHVEGSPTILIGDGLIVSTPYGSSGYFYSVTRKTFESGIGLAFNNVHNANPQHQILDESAEIKVKILRGPGQLAVDNNPDLIDLLETAEITIKKSPEFAKIFTIVQ